MTKQNLIDLCIDYLTGDATPEMRRKYHPVIIEKHIDAVFKQIVNEVHKDAIKHCDYGQLDSFTKSYVVDILTDTERDQKYSILPVSPIKLYKNRGVRSVTATKDRSYTFIYQENGSDDIYSPLECWQVSDKPRYEIEGNRVYFSEHLKQDIDKVRINIIASFESLDDTDEVSIPAGQERFILEQVAKLMLIKPTADTINDNNENSKV